MLLLSHPNDASTVTFRIGCLLVALAMLPTAWPAQTWHRPDEHTDQNMRDDVVSEALGGIPLFGELFDSGISDSSPGADALMRKMKAPSYNAVSTDDTLVRSQVTYTGEVRQENRQPEAASSVSPHPLEWMPSGSVLVVASMLQSKSNGETQTGSSGLVVAIVCILLIVPVVLVAGILIGQAQASATAAREQAPRRESIQDDWDNNEDESLKMELARRLPRINDAPTYRRARAMMKDRGGALSLKAEMIELGVIDSVTGKLTTGEQPFNVFARMAAGLMPQEGMAVENEALGDFKDKFMICKNRKESDDHWNDNDPEWVRSASMAPRHRMLISRTLDWQFFNAIIFGLVPKAIGGFNLADTVEEVEAMKEAALTYARNVGGWSGSVGLFVNCYGHCEVNALFVHILDMSELGPGFQVQNYKNLPLDDVLEVLQEEAEAEEKYWDNSGETSVKNAIAGRLRAINTAEAFREARKLMLAMGGAQAVREELTTLGFLDASGILTTDKVPYNVFARMASGKMVQDEMREEQKALGTFQSKYVVCCNRKESDDHWESRSPRWLPQASMGKRHRILTKKDLNWQWFNPLVFGQVPGGVNSDQALAELAEIKAAAHHYAANVGGWTGDVGLFVNCYGHSEVHSLFVHVLDLAQTGPAFIFHQNKNLALDHVIEVLRDET